MVNTGAVSSRAGRITFIVLCTGMHKPLLHHTCTPPHQAVPSSGTQGKSSVPPRSTPHTRRVGRAAPCARTTYAASACSSDADSSAAASSQRNSAPAAADTCRHATPRPDHQAHMHPMEQVTEAACVPAGPLQPSEPGRPGRAPSSALVMPPHGRGGQGGAPTQPVRRQSAALRRARRLASSAGPWQAVMVQASRCARAPSVTSTPSSAQRRTRHLRQHAITSAWPASTLLTLSCTTRIHHPLAAAFSAIQLRHVQCLWSSGVLSCPDRVSAITFGTRPWVRRSKTRLSHELLHRMQVLIP